MNVYQSKFLNIDFDASKKLFYFTWLEDTAKMSKEDFQQNMTSYAEAFKKHKPSFVLIDDRKMGFIISLELQEWVGSNIFPSVIEAGLKAFAVVTNEDMITNIATELTAEENPDPNSVKSAFFSSTDKAESFLLAQQPRLA